MCNIHIKYLFIFFTKLCYIFSKKYNVIKNYYSWKKHRLSNDLIKYQITEENDENLKENIATIINPIFYDNYLCISFFESITRMVFVKKPDIEKNILIEIFQYKKEKENNEKDFLDTLVWKIKLKTKLKIVSKFLNKFWYYFSCWKFKNI